MRYGFVGALALVLCAQGARAGDLSGDYSGRCDGKTDVQCAIEITDGAQVAIVVADRMDYAKKRCVVSGRLTPDPQGLHGEIRRGIHLVLRATPDSGVYMKGLLVSACGLDLNGYYGAIGD